MLHLLALASAALPQGPGSSTAPVVINEFAYDDTGTDDKEFVELFNRTSSPVDISGWRLIAEDSTTNNLAFTIPAGTILQPGAYWVVGNTAVPNVNQVVASNAWENDGESLELVDATNTLVDSICYETNFYATGGFTSTAAGTSGRTHPVEGAGIRGPITTVDGNPNSYQRRVNGFDTNDNACDFSVMAWTPGAVNGSANTLNLGYRNDFNAAPATSLASDFVYGFVAPVVADPAAVTNAVIAAVPNVITIPASPAGGNIGVMHDTTGGGNASWMKLPPNSTMLVETYVYVRGGNSLFAAPGATGEAETWAFGVGGTTDGPANPHNISGTFYSEIQCTGNRPGATGVGFFAYVQQAQTTIYLVDRGNGSANNILGTIVATTGVNDGWQRLRIRLDGTNLVANFGGTYGVDDGQRFTATGVTNCNGNVWFQYRECLVSNALMTPLMLDRLEVWAASTATTTTAGSASPTTVATPGIGTTGGSATVGNNAFAVTASGLNPFGFGGILLGIGSLGAGTTVPGAPATVLVYVSPLQTNLVLGDGSGNGSSPLAIPPINGLIGLPLTAQVIAYDPALAAAVPIGSSQGLQVVVGN